MRCLPFAASATLLLLVASACEPNPAPTDATAPRVSFQTAPGTGLVLNSVTGLSLPLIGKLGDVTVDQAVITNFQLIENTVGSIVGLQVDGVLQLTGGVLGSDVVTEDFTTTATVTPSGSGQCDVVSIDLGPIAIDALGLAKVDLPTASVDAKASGAVGSLLCSLGSLLSGPIGTATDLVRQVVNTLNGLI